MCGYLIYLWDRDLGNRNLELLSGKIIQNSPLGTLSVSAAETSPKIIAETVL